MQRVFGENNGWLAVIVVSLTCGCSHDSRPSEGGFGTGGGGTAEPAGSETTGAVDDTTGGEKLDVAPPGDLGMPDVDLCKVNSPEGSAPGTCEDWAPPDSFEPDIQWTWTGPNGDISSITTPLVINLTDDDASGSIDLCDVPDVVVLAGPKPASDLGHIYVLDGQTGTEHFVIEDDLVVDLNPAVGDIDGDGLPEIVAGTWAGLFAPQLVAFEHDGTLKWTGDATGKYGDTIALADLDNDGDVEILAGGGLYDHEGTRLFTIEGTSTWEANTAADLDGDGDLEIVSGQAAMHHDGSLYYASLDVQVAGYPQVANLDDDPQPEVLVTTYLGFYVLEHDGTLKYGPLRPTGDPPTGTVWERPAAIHDFDGDGLAEFAQSSAENYSTYERDGSLRWSSPIVEISGIASSTAFDFLGDGGAEAMYADEYDMFIFGEQGEVLLQIPRASTTLTEYPIVADIDNDGSAEIVVTSNGYGEFSPTVQVIRDAEDRWIQARRIWNQHTYHVTNVNEDGTIPQFEQPNWETFNTFRTNAQIENGKWCKPVPEG